MELSREQLEKLIELSGTDMHADEMSADKLSRLLILLERKMNFFTVPIELEINKDISVLIVDDLELSIYQFTKVLRKIGIIPSVARNKEEAMAEIIKNKFDYIIIDLYLPDLKDGMTLIEEAIKLKDAKEQHFKIITMSSTNNQEIIEKCHKSGIDKFVPKSEHWHDEILKYIAQTLKGDDTQSSNYHKYLINSDIMVYSLNKINSKKYIDEVLKDVNLSLALGHKHIIMNFEKIKVFDIENAYFFSDVYKITVSQGGRIVFVLPGEQIRQILEEIYLSDIVNIADSIDTAVASFA